MAKDSKIKHQRDINLEFYKWGFNSLIRSNWIWCAYNKKTNSFYEQPYFEWIYKGLNYYSTSYFAQGLSFQEVLEKGINFNYNLELSLIEWF